VASAKTKTKNLGHENEQPQGGGTDQRDNHREEKRGTQPAVQRGVFPQRNRQQQRKNNAGHHGHQDVRQIIEQRAPED